jgi:hypothetical protein
MKKNKNDGGDLLTVVLLRTSPEMINQLEIAHNYNVHFCIVVVTAAGTFINNIRE